MKTGIEVLTGDMMDTDASNVAIMKRSRNKILIPSCLPPSFLIVREIILPESVVQQIQMGKCISNKENNRSCDTIYENQSKF